MAFKANIEVTTLEEYKEMNNNLKKKEEIIELGCPACGSTNSRREPDFLYLTIPQNEELYVKQLSCLDCGFWFNEQKRKDEE